MKARVCKAKETTTWPKFRNTIMKTNKTTVEIWMIMTLPDSLR